MILRYLTREWKLSNHFWQGLLIACAAAFVVIFGLIFLYDVEYVREGSAIAVPAVIICAIGLIATFFSALSKFSYGFNFAVQMSVRRRDYVLSAFLLHLFGMLAVLVEAVVLSLVFGLLTGTQGLQHVAAWLPWVLASIPLAIGLGWLTGAVLQRFGATAYLVIWLIIVFGGTLISRLIEWSYTDGAATPVGRAVQAIGDGFLALGMAGLQILLAVAGVVLCLVSWSIQHRQEVR